MSVWLEAVKGGDGLEVLSNLMQLYFYDFTAYLNIQVEEDGKFQEYPGLEKYLRTSEKRHHAFLIRSDGHIAGFALVDQPLNHPEGDNYMAEFFILKRFRRAGIGRAAARMLFAKFPGRWFVSQVASNWPAQAFWRSVISEYTEGAFTEQVRAQSGNTVQFFDTAK